MNNENLSTVELERKADFLEQSGNSLDALEYWRVIVGREPTTYNFCRFGELLAELGRREEAIQAFKSAADVNPKLPYAYTRLGLVYLETSRPEKAQVYFKKSLAIEESARLFTLLGVAYLDQGLNAAARESFTKAIESDLGYEEAYFNLGVTLRDEDPHTAIRLFQKAIEIDPDYSIAHRELGWCLRDQMSLTDALHHLNRAIELNNQDGWAYIYSGNTLWANDDLSSAESMFKKATEVWTTHAIPYWCLAFFYEKQGKTAESEQLYQKAVELDPDDIQANLRYGLFFKQIGHPEKAKAYLKRVLDLQPNNEKAKLALVGL